MYNDYIPKTKGQTMQDELTRVTIPGEFRARVKYGKIVGFDFEPASAYAGYFGPEIIHVDGPEIQAEDLWDMVSAKLSHDYDFKSSVITVNWTC
jgi:hypothetical protein